MSDLKFMCPVDGSETIIRSILTSGGERQAIVCNTHGVMMWVGLGRIDQLNPGGIVASYHSGAVTLDDIGEGEYGYVAAGPFKGVWAARPPHPDAKVVVVPTWAATFQSASGVPADNPALVVLQPFTGRWRGRLTGGVWYPTPDVI